MVWAIFTVDQYQQINKKWWHDNDNTIKYLEHSKSNEKIGTNISKWPW